MKYYRIVTFLKGDMGVWNKIYTKIGWARRIATIINNWGVYNKVSVVECEVGEQEDYTNVVYTV